MHAHGEHVDVTLRDLLQQAESLQLTAADEARLDELLKQAERLQCTPEDHQRLQALLEHARSLGQGG